MTVRPTFNAASPLVCLILFPILCSESRKLCIVWTDILGLIITWLLSYLFSYSVITTSSITWLSADADLFPSIIIFVVYEKTTCFVNEVIFIWPLWCHLWISLMVFARCCPLRKNYWLLFLIEGWNSILDHGMFHLNFYIAVGVFVYVDPDLLQFTFFNCTYLNLSKNYWFCIQMKDEV